MVQSNRSFQFEGSACLSALEEMVQPPCNFDHNQDFDTEDSPTGDLDLLDNFLAEVLSLDQGSSDVSSMHPHGSGGWRQLPNEALPAPATSRLALDGNVPQGERFDQLECLGFDHQATQGSLWVAPGAGSVQCATTPFPAAATIETADCVDSFLQSFLAGLEVNQGTHEHGVLGNNALFTSQTTPPAETPYPGHDAPPAPVSDIATPIGSYGAHDGLWAHMGAPLAGMPLSANGAPQVGHAGGFGMVTAVPHMVTAILQPYSTVGGAPLGACEPFATAATAVAWGCAEQQPQQPLPPPQHTLQQLQQQQQQWHPHPQQLQNPHLLSRAALLASLGWAPMDAHWHGHCARLGREDRQLASVCWPDGDSILEVRFHRSLPDAALRQHFLGSPDAAVWVSGLGARTPYVFIGPYTLHGKNFMELSGGYVKTKYRFLGEGPNVTPVEAAGAGMGARAQSSPGFTPFPGKVLFSAPAAQSVWPEEEGPQPPTPSVFAGGAAAAGLPLPIVIDAFEADGEPQQPLVAGGWYLCNFINNTHCLLHHDQRKNSCSQKGHPTHTVHVYLVMQCVEVKSTPAELYTALQSMGTGAHSNAEGGGACGSVKEEKNKGQRKRKAIGIDMYGAKLEDVHFDLTATGQSVIMRFGSTWPAWFEAMPPKEGLRRRRNPASTSAATAANAYTSAATAASTHNSAATAADAACSAHLPAAATACTVPGAACGDAAGGMHHAVAAAVAAAAAAETAAAAAAPAAGGLRQALAADQTGVLQSPGGFPGFGRTAGCSGGTSQAQEDAQKAVESIRLFLKFSSSLSYWRVFLQEELKGTDGRTSELRVRALRDGHHKGFGLLNVVLHEATQQLKQQQQQQQGQPTHPAMLPPQPQPSQPAPHLRTRPQQQWHPLQQLPQPTVGRDGVAEAAAAAAAAAAGAVAARDGAQATTAAAAAAARGGPRAGAIDAAKAMLEGKVVAMFEFLFSLWQDDPRVIQELLKQQDTDSMDTALHTCCRYNLLVVLDWLLARCGPEVLLTATKDVWLPLHTACRCGHEDAAVAYLRRAEAVGLLAAGQESALKVILSDLTCCNKYYRDNDGRRVLERAMCRVWQDASRRPCRFDVTSKEDLRSELQEVLRKVQGLSVIDSTASAASSSSKRGRGEVLEDVA